VVTDLLTQLSIKQIPVLSKVWQQHVLAQFSLSHHQAAVTIIYRGKAQHATQIMDKIIYICFTIISKECHHQLVRYNIKSTEIIIIQDDKVAIHDGLIM
jgi:uncharacterized membrane protein